MDEFNSSHSILGRIEPNFEKLGKLVTDDLKKRVYMEERRTQPDNRFLKDKQIVHMIYDILKICRRDEAFLDFNDLQKSS